MKPFDQWVIGSPIESDPEEIELVRCSGAYCEKMGEPNYVWPPNKDEPDEFYCGGSERCCP